MQLYHQKPSQKRREQINKLLYDQQSLMFQERIFVNQNLNSEVSGVKHPQILGSKYVGSKIKKVMNIVNGYSPVLSKNQNRPTYITGYRNSHVPSAM